MEIRVWEWLIWTVLIGLGIGIVKLVKFVWINPKKLEKLLRKEGVKGNPYRFLVGDMSDFLGSMNRERRRSIQISEYLPPHIVPYYYFLRSKYGENSMVWFGPMAAVVISDPKLLKEILSHPEVFQKIKPDPVGETVAGGLLYLEDHKWTMHRKIINPAFHMEKIKNMVPAIRASCMNMIEKWESLFNGESTTTTMEVDVWPYLENLTGDMISRTAFGSNHDEGRRIFELQKQQLKLVLELLKIFFIPGWRFIPTKANRRMRANSKEIQALLKGIIIQRQNAMQRGEALEDDLLSALIMESNFQDHGTIGKNFKMSMEDVMEECKLFYFAGSETTSLLLVWTMVMLSAHQDWQERAREEVLSVFGKDEPTFDGLARLKTLTMILQEVLRLYPPVPVMSRATKKQVKLGNMTLPAKVNLMLLTGLLHHDPKVWGDDAKEFKPERFSEGVSSASTNAFGFIPFSAGPRVCVGQNFAMVEAKMAMAMILQRFKFELSENYAHTPFPLLTLQPQLGALLLLHKLS